MRAIVLATLTLASTVHADDKPGKVAELFPVTALTGSFATREAACGAAVKAQGSDLGDGNWNTVKITDGVCAPFTGAKITSNKSAKKVITDYAVFDFGQKYELGLVVRVDGKWFFANLQTIHEWRGKSCGGWSYKIDEVSDVVGPAGPAIAVKFSQSFGCEAPGPRDGPDPGDFNWTETGVIFVGVGASKIPSSTPAMIATSTQAHVLGKSTTKTAWLKTVISLSKDGLKVTGTCPLEKPNRCSEDQTHLDSRPRLGVHPVAFP